MITDDYLTGFEIKSDGDSFARLAGQINDYNKYCDYCYIVVGKRHENKAAEHIPHFWGIMVVYELDCGKVLRIVRKASRNRIATTRTQLSLLWSSELKAILARHKLPKTKYRSRSDRVNFLLKSVPEKTLRIDMTDMLFERDYTLNYS